MSSKYAKLDSMNDPFADDDDQFQIDDNDFITPDTQQNSAPALPPKYSSSTPLPSIPETSQSQPQSQSSRKTYEGGFFSINYYRQYFDLNTSEFFHNCIKSMNPFSKPSADEFNQLGDLYGSVWITATLIFLLFFCNSFASLLSGWFLGNDLSAIKVNYFKMIVSSINLLYGYTFLIPALLYILLKFYFKVIFLAPLTKLISIYSYANLLWIPAVLLSTFRGFLINHHVLDAVLKWLCISFGALLSGASISHKLKVYFTTIFGEEEKKHMMICLAALLVAHIGFAIGVKVCFFGKL